MADRSENYDCQLNFWSVVIFHAARSMIFSIYNIQNRKYSEIYRAYKDSRRHLTAFSLSQVEFYTLYICTIFTNHALFAVHTIFTKKRLRSKSVLAACCKHVGVNCLFNGGPIIILCSKFKEQNKQAISRRDRSKYCDFFINYHLNDCDRKWSLSWHRL